MQKLKALPVEWKLLTFLMLLCSVAFRISLYDASLIRSDSIGSNTSGGSAGAPVQMSSTSMVHLRSPTLQYPPIDSMSGSGGGTITTTVDLHAPSGGVGSSNSSLVSSPDASHSGSAIAGSGGGGVVSSTSAVTSNAPKVSVNVLNDIGNMLANLTDELDAMLEEEKRAGLNIDSE